MKRISRVIIVVLMSTAFLVSSADWADAKKGRKRGRRRKPKPAPAKSEPAPEPAPAPATTDDTRVLQRGERIEFDARLIQGQTAKAGAVYLFERASSNLRSMVKDRTSFRDKIIRTVFPKAKEGEEENGS